MTHERFHYRSLDELRHAAQALNVELPVQEDISVLAQSVPIAKLGTTERGAPNRLAIHPMEGCDGKADGSPDELTIRRYLRFAQGGAGLLWFEATAVAQEARANPRQLWLHRGNAETFRTLRDDALAAGREVNGTAYRPYTVLQLTHSGRYSRPVDRPAPIIAHHDGLLDAVTSVASDQPLISDEELDRLQDRYVEAARLAYACGFDAVDFKSCHRYLMSELFAAHTRPGRYGGSFENRTRLLREIVARTRDEVPGLTVVVRMNVYDGHPYPWGWGVSQEDPGTPDLSEPLRFIGLLRALSVPLINVTAGNPYFTPHINRPFDRQVVGGALPAEHPLVGVARLIDLARQIKEAYPDLVVIGTGYSWLRQFMAPVAAGVVSRGWADLIGLGRGAFAYPDFARDLLTKGAMDPRKTCITCSSCTQIMRDHGCTGCVPLDRDVYGPIYTAGRRAHS